MAHKVICFFCQKTFDRDKEPFVKVNGRRYAHKECAEKDNNNILQQENDKTLFFETVKSIYGKNYNFVLINKQASNFIEQYGYTWSGMTKCLNWFYNINHGSLEEGHGGIGIIPYIYDKVYEYYYNIYTAQEKNKTKDISQKLIEFNIQSPRAWRQPPHLLDLDQEGYE